MNYPNFSECEKEFEIFCGEGRTMAGKEIIEWVFSHMNVPHKEIAFLADKIREKYIDVEFPLGRKTHYDVRFWWDGSKKKLGRDSGHGVEYCSVVRGK